MCEQCENIKTVRFFSITRTVYLGNQHLELQSLKNKYFSFSFNFILQLVTKIHFHLKSRSKQNC